jgi:hypothetical protein
MHRRDRVKENRWSLCPCEIVLIQDMASEADVQKRRVPAALRQ